jgi:hypothetical protein
MLPVVLPPQAACVHVVVDYGTYSGAPAGPNAHCTGGRSGDTAAEVLARRSTELGSTPPRYNGNFLCAIDGYPKGSACGDHGTEPYWSVWYWAGGRWVYSQRGVDSYTNADTDKDGCLDPLGFRYHAFEKKETPRAAPPTCGTPTQPPGNPKSPPARRPPVGGQPAAPPTAAPSSGSGGSGGVTATPAGAATGPPGSPAATGAVPTDPTGLDAAPTATAPEPTTPPGVAAPHHSGGVPWTTLLAGLVAAVLIGAAAFRMRRTP